MQGAVERQRILPMAENMPHGRKIQPGKDGDQCGFSAAAFAYDGVYLARLKAITDLIQRLHGAVAGSVYIRNAFRLQNDLAHA